MLFFIARGPHSVFIINLSLKIPAHKIFVTTIKPFEVIKTPRKLKSNI